MNIIKAAIENQQVERISKNLMNRSIIKPVITLFRLLIIDSNDYQLEPPSEDTKMPEGLAEERRSNEFIRVILLFDIKSKIQYFVYLA